MGKVRRLRQKYHLSLKNASTSDTPVLAPPVLPVTFSLPLKAPVPVKLTNESNIFKGVNISISDLQQTLVPQPKSSQVVLGVTEDDKGSQPRECTTQSKKDKRLARRAELLRRIDTVQRLQAEAKQKLKQKKKHVQLTNVQELIDALPALPQPSTKASTASAGKESGKKEKKRSVLPQKQRKKKYMQDINVFKRVLSNDAFKADPLSAISNHIAYTAAQSS